MDGLADVEITPNSSYDVIYYYEKQVLGIIAPILEIVFPMKEWEENLKFPKIGRKKQRIFQKVNLSD
jgi:hypothetical protein